MPPYWIACTIRGQIIFEDLTFGGSEIMHDLHAVRCGDYKLANDDDHDDEHQTTDVHEDLVQEAVRDDHE